MLAPMWKAAVPAGQQPEHSWPRIVRQGKAAPSSPSWWARSRARSSVWARQRSVCGGLGGGVGQQRQHEALGIPEGMAVVAGPGQALGADRALLCSRAGLEGVKEREPQRLLELDVAVDLHVRARPKLVEVSPLLGAQPLPAGMARGGEGGRHLVAQVRKRAKARPAIGEELDQAESLPG